jgi:hypothetical protein
MPPSATGERDVVADGSGWAGPGLEQAQRVRAARARVRRRQGMDGSDQGIAAAERPILPRGSISVEAEMAGAGENRRQPDVQSFQVILTIEGLSLL